MLNTIDEIQKFFENEFPGNNCVIESAGNKMSSVRKVVDETDTRPGNTISGPTMMALADMAIYVAILKELGEPLAVTTHLSINFLRKPKAKKDIIAKCKLIKLGKTIAVGQIDIFSEGEKEMIAQASSTYAIPPRS